MDFDKIKNFQVDTTISFGPDCRAAESMRRNNIRYFSGPFDWIVINKLDYIYDALKNKGQGFFSDAKQDGEDRRKKFRYMVSESTGMISMHHFRKNLSIEDAYFVFRYTMDKRFRELDKIFTEAKSICIVSSRKINTKELTSFIKQFLTLYNFENLYYINIHSTENEEKIIETTFDNVTIYECFFNDVHPDGNNPEINKKFWKGNMEYWDKILNKVSLNKNFVKKYRHYKIMQDLFPSDLKSALKAKYINAKSKILRTLKISP